MRRSPQTKNKRNIKEEMIHFEEMGWYPGKIVKRWLERKTEKITTQELEIKEKIRRKLDEATNFITEAETSLTGAYRLAETSETIPKWQEQEIWDILQDLKNLYKRTLYIKMKI